jgi:hypothetical protein
VLPENLRSNFQRKYEGKGSLKLPLEATFSALAEMGEPEGALFMQSREDFKKIQSARNNSILAHGVNPIGKHTYERLSELVGSLLTVKQQVEFPRIDWWQA